jgi:hypothetical protein
MQQNRHVQKVPAQFIRRDNKSAMCTYPIHNNQVLNAVHKQPAPLAGGAHGQRSGQRQQRARCPNHH